MSHSAQPAASSECQNREVEEYHYRKMARAQLLIERQDREVHFRADVRKEMDRRNDTISELRAELAHYEGRRTHPRNTANSIRIHMQEEASDEKSCPEPGARSDEVSGQQDNWHIDLDTCQDDKAFLAKVVDDNYQNSHAGYKSIIKTLVESRNEYIDQLEQAYHDRQQTFKVYEERVKDQQVLDEGAKAASARREEANLNELHSLRRRTPRYKSRITGLTVTLSQVAKVEAGKEEVLRTPAYSIYQKDRSWKLIQKGDRQGEFTTHLMMDLE